MTPEHFNKLVDSVFGDLRALLSSKEKEYSQGVDRLDQFKKGAMMTNRPSHQVLAGFMLKHTTSIYDMLQQENTNIFSIDEWNQKIYDHINYLLLLLGIIEENATDSNPVPITKEQLKNLKEESKPYQYPKIDLPYALKKEK